MMVVEQVSFADLYIHPLNPRLDPPQAEIDALATNIRELGLIQNLAGLRGEGGKVGVIAGGGVGRCREQPAVGVAPRRRNPRIRHAPR